MLVFTYAFQPALAQAKPLYEDVPPGYTGELTVNGDIIMEQSLSKISDDLEEEVNNKLKKDYIIFYNHIWGKLPEADYLYSLYRLQKDNYRQHFFLNTLFDKNNNAMISTLNFKNFEMNDAIGTSISEILKYGVAPSLFTKGVTKLEVDNMKINKIESLELKNAYKTEIKIRGKEYLSFFIFDEISPDKPIKVFSITQEKEKPSLQPVKKTNKKNIIK